MGSRRLCSVEKKGGGSRAVELLVQQQLQAKAVLLTGLWAGLATKQQPTFDWRKTGEQKQRERSEKIGRKSA